jgi:CRISPR-associated protein Cmx8
MSKIILENDKLKIEYSLLDLPTAQHKAGLAGLLVMVESMKLRKISPLPEVDITPTGAAVCFTKESLQVVFDDLFDAELVEKQTSTKWKDQVPKKIIEVEVSGKEKKQKRFIYDDVQPKGAFLQTYYSDGDGLWIKLWRDMLWNILRGIPKTRNVYEERAKGLSSSEGKRLWHAFSKADKLLKKGVVLTENLSSSLFLGAEDKNPEKVHFVDTVENRFLLLFWSVVSLIHVPRKLKIERLDDRLRINNLNELGYVLTIPDPFNLETFVSDIMDVLRSLPDVKSRFRPRAALIDVFEEGGLEYLYHFTRKKADDTDYFTSSLNAIETYHIQKQDKRIRQLASERILPKPDMIANYEKARGSYKNPFYKRIYLANLIAGLPWFTHAEAVFQNEPSPVFVFSGKTPTEIRFFGKDVRQKFNVIAGNLEIKKEGGLMTEKDQDDQLALRVYRLLQNYIWRRTEEKSGVKFDQFKNNKTDKGHIIYPRAYAEALEKVCSDAFLAMRGRRDQDFVEYFIGTICSVPHFLPETEFLSVAKDLMENWQKIKTLSMLAISANSYLSNQIE